MIRILIYVIFLWAFVGFCLFRRYDNNTDFGTYFSALYTTFHCVLSRPTVLFRLKNIFSENNWSALYFVALTLFGDIVLTSLIIAVGTRNFRDFSIQNFKGRLKYRHVALSAIFELYCEPNSSKNINGGGNDVIDNNLDNSNTNPTTTADAESYRVITLANFILLGKHLGLYYKLENTENAKYLFSTEDVNCTGMCLWNVNVLYASEV